MRVLFYVDTGGSTGGPGMHSVRIWRAFHERWPEATGPLVIPRSDEDRRIFGAQIGDANVRETSGSQTLVRRDAVLARLVDHGGVSLFCGTHPRVLPPWEAAEVVRRVPPRGLGVRRGDSTSATATSSRSDAQAMRNRKYSCSPVWCEAAAG